MSDAGPHVVDASEADFATLVVEESKARPVVVDFWAPWCGPCRTLTPVLEAEVQALAGDVRLVKVNTDENPRLAQDYGIHGIPAVKAFVGGKVTDEFTGVLPRDGVRAFLRGLRPGPEQHLLEEAVALAEAGRFDEADAKAEEALALEPKLPFAWVVRAQAAAARGELDEAERRLGRADGDPAAAATVEHMRARLTFMRAIAERDEEPALRARLEAADDPDAALGVAAHEALAGHTSEAFERLLAVLTTHRKSHLAAAHKLVLALLPLVPEDDARDMRRRLSNVLY